MERVCGTYADAGRRGAMGRGRRRGGEVEGEGEAEGDAGRGQGHPPSHGHCGLLTSQQNVARAIGLEKTAGGLNQHLLQSQPALLCRSAAQLALARCGGEGWGVVRWGEVW